MTILHIISVVGIGMRFLLIDVCQAEATQTTWTYPPLPEPAALSRRLLMSGSLDEAVKDIEKRISRDPKDPQLWVQLMCARSYSGSDKEALEAGRKALQLKSPDAIPFAVGLLLKEEHFTEAVSLVPHLNWLLHAESAPAWLRIEAGTLLISYALAIEDRSLLRAHEATLLQIDLEDVYRASSLESLSILAGKADLPEIGSRAHSRWDQLIKAARTGKKFPAESNSNPFPESTKLAAFDRISLNVENQSKKPTYPFPPARELADELQLIKRGEVSAALSSIKAVLEKRPNYARGWRFLGSCHASTGDFLAARNCYSNAVMLQDGPAVVGLAKVEEKIGDSSLLPSLRAHLKYIQLDVSERIDLRFEAMYFLARLADQERSADQLKRIVGDSPKVGEENDSSVKPERDVTSLLIAIEAICRKWDLEHEAGKVRLLYKSSE